LQESIRRRQTSPEREREYRFKSASEPHERVVRESKLSDGPWPKLITAGHLRGKIAISAN